MKSRQPYSLARIFYDAQVAPGDYIKCESGKTAYFVRSVRPSPTIARRNYLEVLRWPPDEIPADATVRSLRWYPRARKR